MSSDCEPTVKIDVDDPQLQAALRKVIPDPAAASSAAYPAAGELVVTIGRATHDLGGVPYPSAESCLTAVWDDRFQHVPVRLSRAELCETGKNATPSLARQEAEAKLVAAIVSKAARIREGYREIAANLEACTLTASSPVTQLTLALRDKHIGPFAGTKVELACLPKDNLTATYKVDGQNQGPFEISPAMCEKVVALDVPGHVAVDPGHTEPPPVPPPPDRMALTWFAVIASTIFLGSTLFVILRNLFSREPINEGAARFLRIMIAVFSAGFASALTGFLTVRMTNETLGLAIDAGAGLGFAVLVYFFNPGILGSKRDAEAAGPGDRALADRQATKHNILFLAANPVGTDRLALDKEARAIYQQLERAGYRDRFELYTRWAAQPLDLLDELRKLRPTIVHFSGHGGSLDAQPADATRRDVQGPPAPPDATPRRGLFFQGPDGRAELVSATALERTFSAAGTSVKLVVLNACYSDDQAEALVAHVDCVVGMAGTIPDPAAMIFAVGFYGGLGERGSVAKAYEEGRAALALKGYDSVRPKLTVRDGVDPSQIVLAADG